MALQWKALERGGRRRAAVGALSWVGFVVGCGVVPGSALGRFVVCPFRALTHYSCPGCGMTRSCHLVVQGRVWESMLFHPFGVVVVVGFGVWALGQGVGAVRGKQVVWSKEASRRWGAFWVGVLCATLGWWGLRAWAEWWGILTPV